MSNSRGTMASRARDEPPCMTAPDIGARPLVVQSDGTILLEVESPGYSRARDLLSGFAQLERSPEYVHTYRLTPLSLWNAAAVGLGYDEIATGLAGLSRYPVPTLVLDFVRDQLSRYGRTRLAPCKGGELMLTSDDPNVLVEVAGDTRVQQLIWKSVLTASRLLPKIAARSNTH